MEGLKVKALGALLGGHVRFLFSKVIPIWGAGGVLVPEEFDVSAQWQPANAPSCPRRVVPAEDFASKTDRENVNPGFEEPGNTKVT